MTIMTDENLLEFAREGAAQREASKVCRHADPRCIDDPLPVWHLATPDELRALAERVEKLAAENTRLREALMALTCADAEGRNIPGYRSPFDIAAARQHGGRP